jgi:hypothetical protein
MYFYPIRVPRIWNNLDSLKTNKEVYRVDSFIVDFFVDAHDISKQLI